MFISVIRKPCSSFEQRKNESLSDTKQQKNFISVHCILIRKWIYYLIFKRHSILYLISYCTGCVIEQAIGFQQPLSRVLSTLTCGARNEFFVAKPNTNTRANGSFSLFTKFYLLERFPLWNVFSWTKFDWWIWVSTLDNFEENVVYRLQPWKSNIQMKLAPTYIGFSANAELLSAITQANKIWLFQSFFV